MPPELSALIKVKERLKYYILLTNSVPISNSLSNSIYAQLGSN
jgi:hypothetical protein